jgi:hypothetical protein
MEWPQQSHLGIGGALSRQPARWRYTPEQLAQAVSLSRSVRQVLAHLGLATEGGGAYVTVQKRIRELDLDTSHFLGRGWNRGNVSGMLQSGAIPLELLLTADSPCTSRGRLKSRLLRAGLLENRCQVCGLGPSWQGSPLTLRLDHVNGVPSDNRLENLRMVCPNCDSQLPTFAGRNSRSARGSGE